MNVKDEKNANTIIVRFDTSTSPSWKDVKIFIIFFLTLTQFLLLNLKLITNSK